MATGQGEWIWRPLSNRTALSFTSLMDRDPAGFGLFQRDRDFGSYLDLEALYHRRPSLWVEPLGGDWGTGAVQLVEIPTESEFNDNVVAYWAPDGGLEPGGERRFSYRLTTMNAEHPDQAVARVVRTAVGWDALPGQVDPPPRTRRRVVVDFAGPPLDGRPLESLRPVLSLSAGTWDDLRLQRLPGGGVRATFALVPDGDTPADMRLFLVRSQGEDAGPNGAGAGFWNSSLPEATSRVLTETWSYLWDPVHAR
jgi:glucans biosynthesis protein